MSFLFREYGARPHQNGRGPGNDAPGHYGSGYFNLSQRAGSPGPLIEHVKDGKPLTALGKKLVAVAGHQPCCVGPTSHEREVWEQLETARQQVRPLIKREVEGEPVTKELLNLRLKVPG